MIKTLLQKSLQASQICTKSVIGIRMPQINHVQSKSFIICKPMRLFSTLQNGQNEINEALKDLKDEKGRSIMDNKLIHSMDIQGGTVNIKLNLTQDYRKVKTLITSKLQSVGWIQTVNVSMAPAQQQAKPVHQGKKGLQNVKNILAVSSCKGGVGKSTVSVNLAFSLQKLGLKIGIFDADLYGPSLPTMISPQANGLFADEEDPQMISPIQFNGILAMSYGFASSGKSAIMRGPIASNLVTQLVGNTNWRDLDYLVIDFPPGTGDIQLTLGQELALKAAVIVTTPQKLAYVDVVKGIEMFDQLKVPTIAIVENMSYYKCSSCDTKHKIFGMGYINELRNNFGIKNSFEVPIMEEVSAMSDSGTPFVLTLPDHLDIVQTYNNIAIKVVEEVENLDKISLKPEVRYDPKEGMVIVKTGEKVKKIDPFELRTKCKCAGCIDEISGVQILKVDKVPKDVHPTNIVTKGNYAVAMVWSDGHKSSIYPFERILDDTIITDQAKQTK